MHEFMIKGCAPNLKYYCSIYGGMALLLHLLMQRDRSGLVKICCWTGIGHSKGWWTLLVQFSTNKWEAYSATYSQNNNRALQKVIYYLFFLVQCCPKNTICSKGNKMKRHAAGIVHWCFYYLTVLTFTNGLKDLRAQRLFQQQNTDW